MKVPVTIYSEITPNPSTMKFVANKYILPTGETANFTSKKDTIGFSPLAEELFQLPFVDGVFMASNFVTITKTENVSWDFITMQLREYIREWISEGKEILLKSQELEEPTISNVDVNNLNFDKTEFDHKIAALLDEYVRPAVENDGGAIDYVGYKEGQVTVLMKGSCAGCPSSTATLKGGIETLLKQHIPEVKEVIALNPPM
ncbi:NifU family protein [Crocinitomicaceae bacterium]|jgi:Fe-S cluster biogenesis protein NfuA|nr:NifU family protein [Flavobacteriales bacterium]MBT5933678.1 NifU family protein [Flavobacteriales bacterium]MDA7761710.1 NifU family protein [Crocinitomicaceae bacterium]MDB4340145.1 NifU family protein [Crocinitomicaceae bacterium]MDC1266378.1 NifU family protein [Crocinitomicaceae bacterium]